MIKGGGVNAQGLRKGGRAGLLTCSWEEGGPDACGRQAEMVRTWWITEGGARVETDSEVRMVEGWHMLNFWREVGQR